MTGIRRTFARRIALRGALIVALLIVTGTAASGQTALADEGEGDGNLTVDISDGLVPTPPPTVPPSGRPTGRQITPPAGPPITPPGRLNVNGQTSGSFIDTADPPSSAVDQTPPTPPAPEPDEVSLGGVLLVGGLAGGFSPSLNPLAGQLQVWFTVRNVSTSTIDATADFWLAGPFGHRISEVDDVTVTGMVPGEKRTISATLQGVGQWTFVTVHARLTPPPVVDNAELSSFTRDANVFAPPWLIAVLIVVGLGFAAVRYFLRRLAQPVRVGEPA
ncbi:hypothetical protein [Agromyces bauzanensis]|uniref:DUF916 domain-containing protein n=1 Tax=Agromyces bauzanensis TaxID=1308924 RepID=A0A917UPP0_9MICO|nr:hypothetical protein [Agromyces bauzanensis]GGJ73094.1 hypothetical protein GCM10011372_08860 [Agromyces bauzanensis]